MKIKRFSDTALLPTRATAHSAGYDLYADLLEPIIIKPHEARMIPTGIGMNIPREFFGGIYARSGWATKRGLRPSNCVGCIDSDYTGQIYVSLHNDSDEEAYIYGGDRIAQLIFQPYAVLAFEEVGELDATDRGEGGFGSTGR